MWTMLCVVLQAILLISGPLTSYHCARAQISADQELLEAARAESGAQKVNNYEWASFFPVAGIPFGTTAQPLPRAAATPQPYVVHLQAYHRNLTMILTEVAVADYDDVEVTVVWPNGTERFSVAESIHYYRGHVLELPQSRAHGVLRRNGLFEGVIESAAETFFVESPLRFFGNFSRIKSSKESANRAIIYRWEDMNRFPVEAACAKNDPSCYYYQTILHYKALFPPSDDRAEEPLANRATLRKTNTDAKTCYVQVVADHRFYQNVGLSSVQKTLEAIVWHIEEADHLFRSTDWESPRAPGKVGVSLKKVTIFTSANSPGNVFKDDVTSDEEFLKKFRSFNTSDSCISMVFTYAYLQGTFGISYVGTVCNPKYNWALVNFRSMDGEVRQRAASVITAMHEIAHVFGANHDMVNSSPAQCVPGGHSNSGMNGGNFIMYPTSAMGMYKNNRHFSPCSISSIGKNLQNVARTKCMAPVRHKLQARDDERMQ